MTRLLTIRIHFAALTLLLAWLVPGAAAADEPVITTSDDVEHHEGEAMDANDSLAESGTPDGVALQSGAVDSHEGASHTADTTAESRAPGDLAAESSDASDLAHEDPEAGAHPIEMPGQKEWEPTDDPEIVAARENLEAAQARAQEARAAYGKMIRRNHPRGEAREQIVRERDHAMRDLAAAEAALKALGDAPPANGL